MAEIEMRDMDSTYLAAVGHDEATLVMRVKFTNGTTWEYTGVPRYVFDGVVERGGRFFAAEVRGKYSSSKVGDGRVVQAEGTATGAGLAGSGAGDVGIPDVPPELPADSAEKPLGLAIGTGYGPTDEDDEEPKKEAPKGKGAKKGSLKLKIGGVEHEVPDNDKDNP